MAKKKTQGWLDKYQDGGEFLGTTNEGFDYNGAWNGPSMQKGGNLWKTDKKAYVDSALNANKNLDWVKRLYESNPKAMMVPGETSPSTHLIGDNDQGYVFPSIVNIKGQLVDLGDRAEDYARETNTGIQFPKEQGTWFARSTGEDSGYKMGTGVLKGKPVMQKYKSIDKKAMGGSLPGAVGFTYARTQGAAPSNGPYAKKTMASAQNGMEMKFYQEGLDWTPRNISEYGSEIPNAQKGKKIDIGTLMRANQVINQADNTGVKTPESLRKIQPRKEMTKQQVHALNLEGQRKQSRIADRKAAVNTKDKGTPYTLPSGETKKYSDMDWREKAYVDGKALEQRGRINPNDESFFDEWINPVHQLTNIASGLGKAPYEARESGSIRPYIGAIGTPLVAGALGFDPLGAGLKTSVKVAGLAKRAFNTTPFQSEINWGAWNSEIPSNKALMDEYRVIEQTSKANGSWMKNPDGSAFQGTPEQFVQQNSQNFKKAYPQGFTTGYRGARKHIDNFADRQYGDWATFLTDSKANAETYASSDGLSNVYYHPDINPSNKWVDGMYQLGIPNDVKKVIGNAEGRNWRLLNYDDKVANGTLNTGFAQKFQDELKEGAVQHYGLQDYNPNKQYLSTDIYANYVKNPKNPEAIAEIKQVQDQMGYDTDIQIPTNTVYAIDANRVPLKSLRYNNGMFDMTNPNIYKAVVPGAIALGAASQTEQKKQGGVIKDDRGQWAHPGEITEIGSNNITMEGVPYPVLGISDEGDTKLMKPGKNYKFKGKKVTEYPVMQKGGWLDKYEN